MSVEYLREAVARKDAEALIRYVRLHFGDGNESVGENEVDKAWTQALLLLLDTPVTDREFIEKTVANEHPATLAHLFFRLHFYFVQRSHEWIHDGTL